MSDPIDVPGAVIEALVVALKGGVTGADVYGVAPDKAQPPFVLIRSLGWDEIGGKTGRAWRVTASIVTVGAGTSKRRLFDLRAQVAAALDGKALSAVAGVALSGCRHLSGSDEREADDNLLIAQDEFLIFAQPA